MGIQLVYMTAADREEADRIAADLVESRTAACANIIDGMRSVYRWEGRLCKDTEQVVIAKTTDALLERLIERVCALHSYECPCIVSFPVTGGHSPFLEWIAAEVTP